MKPSTKPPSNYQKIWKVVERIPKGAVATYGQVARVSGLPRQARLVGYALHNLPMHIGVPWQRVINAHGKISFPKHSAQHRHQQTLLEEEGVLFANGRVDLKVFGWKK
jgi:methylated-DNA-protein-cysteine methyltransferase related protein